MKHSRDPDRKRRLPPSAESRLNAWHNEPGHAQARWRRPRETSNHLDAVLQRLRWRAPGEPTA